MSSFQGGVVTYHVFISLTAVSYDGLFWAGDAYLLGVQALAVLVITVWSMVSTFVLLFTIDLVRIVTIHTKATLCPIVLLYIVY